MDKAEELHGVYLARVLDMANRHHKLLTYLFNYEFDPIITLRPAEREICKQMRTLVSRFVEILFITIVEYQDAPKQKVWNWIYERIEFDAPGPYRFSRLNPHQHIRLDDQVRDLLTESSRRVLPPNFATDYGYTAYSHHVPSSSSDESAPTASNTLLAPTLRDELIYSPTAKVMAGPSTAPVVGIFYDPVRYLRRPIPIRKPQLLRGYNYNHPEHRTSYEPVRGYLHCPIQTRRTQSPQDYDYVHPEHGTFYDPVRDHLHRPMQIGKVQSPQDHGRDHPEHSTDSDSSVSGESNSTETEDMGGPSQDALARAKGCSLCSLILKANSIVTSARAEIARGGWPLINEKNSVYMALVLFETEWRRIRAQGKEEARRGYHPDPNGYYSQPKAIAGDREATANAILEFLEQQRREARQDRRKNWSSSYSDDEDSDEPNEDENIDDDKDEDGYEADDEYKGGDESEDVHENDDAYEDGEENDTQDDNQNENQDDNEDDDNNEGEDEDNIQEDDSEDSWQNGWEDDLEDDWEHVREDNPEDNDTNAQDSGNQGQDDEEPGNENSEGDDTNDDNDGNDSLPVVLDSATRLAIWQHIFG